MTATDPSNDLFLQGVEAEDPTPFVHRLREEDPVHRVAGLGFWIVTLHEDVKRLFNDPENVDNDPRLWEHHESRGPEGSFLRWVEDNGLFAMPPEEHARIRRLVSVALTPRAVRRMESQIREVVERFAAPLRFRGGEVLDLMQHYTAPIPNAVISRITGVPPEGDDDVRFRELAQNAIRGFIRFTDAEVRKLADDSFLELAEWVRKMSHERRAAPREDLVSDLIRAQDRDDRLSDDEIVMMVTSLVSAGSETTALGGLMAVRTLLEHPEELERLRADRSLLPTAVDEILRWGFNNPGGLPRYAVRDFELRGKQIRKGEMLMLSFAGANRDPRVFDDPDAFDVARDNREMLIFGNGPHYCLGANLARQEMACIVDGLLDILTPGSTVREDLMEIRRTGFFPQALNLPVAIA